MSQTYPTMQWNTRERALSNDLNKQARLVSRGITETATAIVSGTLRKAGIFGIGFLVTPMAGTMKSTISPGTALFVDGVSVYPDSSVQWVESTVIREVTHEAADASTRFDVIEMKPGTQVVSAEPRDQFNPVTGTFQITNMVKEVTSYPEFQVRKGTPSATPSIPAGTAGWMPLAYVRVVGNAVSVVATDVVYCRPILDAQDGLGYVDPTTVRYATKVLGGGLAAAGGNTTATVATALSGRFPGAFHSFRVDPSAEAKLSTLVVDGGVLPASSCALYFYAIPAPYPAGYDTSLAPRELWSPDVDMLYGSNAGFTNAGRQDGCLIVASENAPTTTTQAGAPAVGGTSSLNHTFFAAGASSSDRTKWVYIGAVSYDQGLNTFNAQTYSAGCVATINKPGTSYFGVLPIAVDTALSMWTEASGETTVRWPTTARNISAQFISTIGAGGWHEIAAVDSASSALAQVGGHAYMLVNNSAAQRLCAHNADMIVDNSGQFTMKFASHSSATTAKVYGRHYTDSVIAGR